MYSIVETELMPLTLWGLVWPIYKIMQKSCKNDWNTVTWVLIWEYSARAIQCIATWQGLDGFWKSLHSCTLDKSSLSIRRVKAYHRLLFCHFPIFVLTEKQFILIPFDLNCPMDRLFCWCLYEYFWRTFEIEIIRCIWRKIFVLF